MRRGILVIMVLVPTYNVDVVTDFKPDRCVDRLVSKRNEPCRTDHQLDFMEPRRPTDAGGVMFVQHVCGDTRGQGRNALLT